MMTITRFKLHRTSLVGTNAALIIIMMMTSPLHKSAGMITANQDCTMTQARSAIECTWVMIFMSVHRAKSVFYIASFKILMSTCFMKIWRGSWMEFCRWSWMSECVWLWPMLFWSYCLITWFAYHLIKISVTNPSMLLPLPPRKNDINKNLLNEESLVTSNDMITRDKIEFHWLWNESSIIVIVLYEVFRHVCWSLGFVCIVASSCFCCHGMLTQITSKFHISFSLCIPWMWNPHLCLQSCLLLCMNCILLILVDWKSDVYINCFIRGLPVMTSKPGISHLCVLRQLYCLFSVKLNDVMPYLKITCSFPIQESSI